MAVLTITKDNLETEVVKSEKPVLLDFWAPWCGPCLAVAPVMDDIAESVTDIKVGKVNVDEEPELAAAFGAMSIPLIVFVKDGAVVSQTVGAASKEELLQMMQK